MKYQCSARSLAHYVVEKCYRDGHPVSNLQLQKILYFLQVVFCRSRGGKELLFPAEFQAWPYGPVLPEIYKEFSKYGGRAIEKKYGEGNPSNDPEIMRFIDDGIDILSKKSPWDLVNLSHMNGTPWDQIYNAPNGYKSVIPNELLVAAACKGH